MKANPCPRCGHEPHVYLNLLTDGQDKWMVKCVFCGLKSTAKRKWSAIRQWNRIVAYPLTHLARCMIEVNQNLCTLVAQAGCAFADLSDAVRSAFSECDDELVKRWNEYKEEYK